MTLKENIISSTKIETLLKKILVKEKKYKFQAGRYMQIYIGI